MPRMSKRYIGKINVNLKPKYNENTTQEQIKNNSKFDNTNKKHMNTLEKYYIYDLYQERNHLTCMFSVFT